MPYKAEVVRLIDDAIDAIQEETGSAFLFGFSVSALGHISPELLKDVDYIRRVDFSDAKEKYRGESTYGLFPCLKNASGIRGDLIVNIYQAIKGNANLDDIAELISWCAEGLAREGYSPPVIATIFRDSIEIGLECARRSPRWS